VSSIGRRLLLRDTLTIVRKYYDFHQSGAEKNPKIKNAARGKRRKGEVGSGDEIQ